MRIDRRGILRLMRYSVVGISTFIFDLGLLFLLTDVFSWHPVMASGIAFATAVSINYFCSRKFIFRGSVQSTRSSYGIFLLIALCGFGLVIGGMALLVTVWHWHYLFSRILIALVTGFWNYLLNLYVNFQVAGKNNLP